MEIDKEKFIFLYSNEYGNLNPSQINGISFLLSMFEADELMKDVRWISYCMATIKHECAGKWQPIEEYGKGKGLKYGKPDPITGKTYYGRGWVQLTWADNYKAMGEALGIDLYRKPELALNQDTAYKIMSRGMRTGAFTGKKLAHYIDGDRCDFLNARRIINGTDKDELIAGYATAINNMLKECA